MRVRYPFHLGLRTLAAGELILALAVYVGQPNAVVLSAVVSFGVSVAVLNEWNYRNWRAAALLFAYCVVMFGVGLAPLPYSAIARGIATAATLWIAFLSQWLVTDRPGTAFAEAYDRQIKRLIHLDELTERAAYEQEWAAIVESINAIPAPTPGWQMLKDATLAELRGRGERAKVSTPLPDEEWNDLARRWNHLEAQWRQQLAVTTRFWAGIPIHRPSGPGRPPLM